QTACRTSAYRPAPVVEPHPHPANALRQAAQPYHNESPKPFIWTAKAADILEKVKRARAALHNGQSA
ncbi:MAG: hypothetical protein ACLPH3_03280, partial [Terracidiphilus sp.]